jgi:hypothetical protein
MEAHIQVAIHPGQLVTRVLATGPAGETLLKARLARTPWHTRALPSFLEARALWEREPIRGVIFVEPAADPYASDLCASLADEHARTPLYTLDLVPARRAPRRADPLRGLGNCRDHRDLRQLLLFEDRR